MAVFEIDGALSEALKQETAELRKSTEAFVACLVLLPADWCEAEEGTTGPAPLPPKAVQKVPTLQSVKALKPEEVWVQYSDFFERFKEVWAECPGRDVGAGYIPAAAWLNGNTARYRQILEACRGYDAQWDKRAWPPGLK